MAGAGRVLEQGKSKALPGQEKKLGRTRRDKSMAGAGAGEKQGKSRTGTWGCRSRSRAKASHPQCRSIFTCFIGQYNMGSRWTGAGGERSMACAVRRSETEARKEQDQDGNKSPAGAGAGAGQEQE